MAYVRVFALNTHITNKFVFCVCVRVVFSVNPNSLLKHAYSNIQIKVFDIFHISARNIDCGYSLEPPRRGGSNEYLQSMF